MDTKEHKLNDIGAFFHKISQSQQRRIMEQKKNGRNDGNFSVPIKGLFIKGGLVITTVFSVVGGKKGEISY